MGPPGGSKPPPRNDYDTPSGSQMYSQQEQQRNVLSVPSQASLPQDSYTLPPNTNIPPPETVSPQAGRRSPQPPQADHDSPDGHSVNVNVHYQQGRTHSSGSQDEVTESTPSIFTSFIVNRMDNDGYDVPNNLRERRPRNNEKEIAKVLQRIGDDMSNNTQLNHLIGSMRVTPDTAYKTFVSVASQIFQDGTINWGRIVTLFYFAYKLAVQVLNQLPLIDIVIGWVTKFVAEKLSSWIWNRGGWGAVREYFGATPTQLFCVFCAGVALSSLFWLWKK